MLQLNEDFGVQAFRLGDCVERETMRRALLRYGVRALMKAYPANVDMLRYLALRRSLDYFGQVRFVARAFFTRRATETVPVEFRAVLVASRIDACRIRRVASAAGVAALANK